jgi:hypothetical protein
MWFTFFLAQAIETNKRLTVQQAFAHAQKGMQELLKKRREAREQEPTMTDNALLPIMLVP